jgi:hypothetical protein
MPLARVLDVVEEALSGTGRADARDGKVRRGGVKCILKFLVQMNGYVETVVEFGQRAENE